MSAHPPLVVRLPGSPELRKNDMTLKQILRAKRRWRPILLSLASLSGCTQGQSDAEVGPGIGGGSVGGRGSAGVSGTSNGGSTGCAPQTDFALGVHVTMQVSWPTSIGTQAGTGELHLWNLAELTANRQALTGTTRACGTILPPTELSALLGGTLLIQIPPSIWDSQKMPKFETLGVISGWNVGDSLEIQPIIALVGLTMNDPSAAWPAAYGDSSLQPLDVDGDVPEGDPAPGLTAIPNSDPQYVLPPVSLFGTRADRLHLITRTVVSLSGELTSCEAQSGTAQVSRFDSHVIGCRVSGGGACNPGQVDFIDQNRTMYSVTGATFTSKRLTAGRSCADVRAALPL